MKIPCVLWVIASSSAPKGYSPNILCLTVPPVHPRLAHWSLRPLNKICIHCYAALHSRVVRSAYWAPLINTGSCVKGSEGCKLITSRNIFLAFSTLISDKISFCVTTTKVYTCVSQRIRKWYNDQLKPYDRNKILHNSTGRVVESTGSTSSCRLQHRSSFWSSPP